MTGRSHERDQSTLEKKYPRKKNRSPVLTENGKSLQIGLPV
jgi:hypothetical protein